MKNDFNIKNKHAVLICCFVIMTILCGISIQSADKFTPVDKIPDFKLEIGAIVPLSFFDASQSTEMLKTGPEQSLPGYNVLSKGIKYKIGVDQNNAIAFIYTDDKKFATPEGIKVGTNLMDALQLSPDSSLIVENGWVCYIRLKSGWNAALDDDSGMSIFAKVIFIFQQKQRNNAELS
jgi:hypothetical protein